MVLRRCQAMLKDTAAAEDALQDVFLSLLKAGGRVKADYPSSLLYTIATNTCLNRLRRGRTQGPFPTDNDGEPVDIPANDRSVERIDTQLQLEAILNDESDTDRALIYMHLVDGMTLQEAGKACGLSISGARKRIEAFKRRARTKLEADR
jgi:RNA polymerase sigma-70 factor (ECF subfamily)